MVEFLHNNVRDRGGLRHIISENKYEIRKEMIK